MPTKIRIFILFRLCPAIEPVMEIPRGGNIYCRLMRGDASLGIALLDALSGSRFVLSAPRPGSFYPRDVEFDPEIYGAKNIVENAEKSWKDVMNKYGYKTRQRLFKKMELSWIEMFEDFIEIVPMRHVKLENWQDLGPDRLGSVKVANGNPEEIGAALRLAFARCIE